MRPFLTTTFAALALSLALAPSAEAQIKAPMPDLSANPADVRAGTYVSDKGHSKITWSINHFGFSTYLGQFSKFTATLKVDPKAAKAADLQVTIDPASVSTTNPALDAHIKSPDFLDVGKFPEATFKSTAVKVTGKGTADVTGDLTVHGVTKPVVLHVAFVQGGVNPLDKRYSIGFQGKAKLKRSDFGILSYLPALGDEVTLQVDTEMKLQP